jgi:hypothetical protein
VSKATVSRDLKYCRSHPLPVPSVGNAAELIGWHVECCQEVRRLAYDELAQLNLDPLASGSEGSLARLICLRVIVHAERLLLFGLEAAGLLPATWRSLRRRRRRRKGAAGRPLPTPHPYPERGR